MNKKIISICIGIILLISLLGNVHSILEKNKPALKINDNIILTNKEFNKKLNKAYKVNVINSILDRELLVKGANDSDIEKPTDNDLREILQLFPGLNKFEEEITESNREYVENMYYIYNLYLKYDKSSINDMKSKLRDNFGIMEHNEYVVKFYETTNSKEAKNIENDLTNKMSIKDIEKKYQVKFDTTKASSMEKLLEEDYKNGQKYKSGDIFNIPDSDKKIVAYIESINSLENNKDAIKDEYFLKNYNLVKSQMINKLRGEYVIEY